MNSWLNQEHSIWLSVTVIISPRLLLLLCTFHHVLELLDTLGPILVLGRGLTWAEKSHKMLSST